VYCTYATPRGHAHVGARLYLPKEWATHTPPPEATTDPGPITVTPDPVTPDPVTPDPVTPDPVTPDPVSPDPLTDDQCQFKTKPALAVDILTDLLRAHVLPPWVTGDEVYGQSKALRTFRQDHGVGYVLEVACSFTIQLNSQLKARADKALNLVPAKGWTRASCGPGSKGDRLYEWAWIATTSPRHHLLVRRNLNDPTDRAYFYCYTPEPRPITLGLLVTVAGMRWPVEEDFQVGKDQFGLDHSQVRLYEALVRHLALAMIALAIGATTAAAMRTKTSTLPPPPTTPDQEPPDDPGLIPLTVAETRRLLNLLTRTWHTRAHHLHWTWRRRRHQARARWFHQRTRLRRELNQLTA
jgi:SRSO17 transposase